jgi:hypothetical protein
MHTFGALVMARNPDKIPAKADWHLTHSFSLGFGSTPKHVRYFDTTISREKLSSHHVIDEDHYEKCQRSSGAQLLMDMGYEISTTLLSNIDTPTPISQYTRCCKTFPATPFICKFFQLPMNEFTTTLLEVAALITASDIARSDGITVTFSTHPFGPSFPEMISVSGIDPTLIFNLHYDTDRHRYQIIKMDPGTPAHRIPQCRNGAFIFTMLLFSVSTKPLSTQLPMHSRPLLRHDSWKTKLLVLPLPRMMHKSASPQLVFPNCILTNVGSRSGIFRSPLLQSSTKPSLDRNSTVGISIRNTIRTNCRMPNGFSLATIGIKTCLVHHALRQLMHRYFSGYSFTALSHMRTIKRMFEASVMVPLVVEKPWYMVSRMLQSHSRLTFASRWLSHRILACLYGTPCVKCLC